MSFSGTKLSKTSALRISFVAAPLIALCFVACGGSRDLDRTTVMRLVEGKNFGIVRTSIPTGGDLRSRIPGLIEAGILKCTDYGDHGRENWGCAKGPNAGDVRGGWMAYEYAIGELYPAKTTGITKIGEDSAVAVLELTFRPNEAYQKYGKEFDQFKKVNNMTEVLATFQRYDDGWRFEGVKQREN